MKTIFLIEGRIKDQPATYADFIRTSIDTPPKDGFTLTILRERNRIEKQLEISVQSERPIKELNLEDSDYIVLKNCVSNIKWVVRDQFILDFLEVFEKS
jgi:uncharacterized membrane protein